MAQVLSPYWKTYMINDKESQQNETHPRQEWEELDILEIPFEKALAMMESGKIKDAKTLILLQYAQLKQLL